MYHKKKQIKIINKEDRRKLGKDGYVYGLDYGDSFMFVYLSPNSLSFIH